MLDRLKKIGEAAKQVVLFILVPVFFVAGYVYYLLTKNKNLEDALAASEADKKLEVLKGEQTEIDNESTDALERYRKLRGEALSGSDSSLRPGPSGAGVTDQGEGSGAKSGGSST